MAKTKDQTRTLWRYYYNLLEKIRAHLEDIDGDIATINTEIDVGGPEEYMVKMHADLDILKAQLKAYWQESLNWCAGINMPLGAYAGSANPVGSEAVNVSLFNDKLVADGESVISLGLTQTPFAADGGNTGTGVVVELTTGVDRISLEGAHEETIRLRCVSLTVGRRAGFSLIGGQRKEDHWSDQMGNGDGGNGYVFDWGHGKNDFCRATQHVVTSEFPEVISWDGSDERNMVTNGNLEGAWGTGNSKIPGATIISGEANITEETTTPLVGSKSAETSDSCEIEFPTVGDIVGRPEFSSLIYRRRGTITGTLEIIYRHGPASSPTDTSLESIAIGGLTADQVYHHKQGFIVPADLGENPRTVIKVTKSGGTGSVEFDELIRGALSLYDSNRAIAVIDGVTKFRRGDGFTGSNSITYNTTFQRHVVELFGRSIKHSGGGSYWTVV